MPAEVDLKAELGGLGAVPLPAEDRDGQAVAWFADGQVVKNEPERAANLGRVKGGDNPLERINDEVQRRVGKHFEYTRAVTFGNLGGKQE